MSDICGFAALAPTKLPVTRGVSFCRHLGYTLIITQWACGAENDVGPSAGAWLVSNAVIELERSTKT